MDGVFPGEFELWRGDQWANRLHFVAANGFHGTGVSVDDLADPARSALLDTLAQRHAQRYAVHLGLDYHEPTQAAHARLSAAADIILKRHAVTPLTQVVLVVKVPGNRFDRSFELGRQLEALAAHLGPLVERCRSAQLPVAIENHGDYYISDLMALCQRVDGLEIQLDTGNCFLIGERPDHIPEAAFAYVRSTHWKDHWVCPNLRELKFELKGATLGAGHVGLDALYERILRLHPQPATVNMRVEWIPSPDKPVLECFRASLQYLQQLSDGQYTVPLNQT